MAAVSTDSGWFREMPAGRQARAAQLLIRSIELMRKAKELGSVGALEFSFASPGERVEMVTALRAAAANTREQMTVLDEMAATYDEMAAVLEE